MKKSMIALLGGIAILAALGGGYCLTQGHIAIGVLFCVTSAVTALTLFMNMNRESNLSDGDEHPDSENPAMALRGSKAPAINLSYYNDLNRLIDEGKEINSYLRSCDAPKNIVRRINPGGTTAWYYNKSGMEYNEFCADFPHGESPKIVHPHIKEQRIDQFGATDVHTLTVDLYRALWDWGELHPEQKRYTNSMRLSFHGAYKANKDGDTSFLGKDIYEIRSARKANKKKPKKQKKTGSQESV